MAAEQYATVADLRALDGLNDEYVYPDAVLSEAIAFAVETVTEYCGQDWEAPPVAIRWAVRTIARQWCIDLHSRIPDRSLQVNTDYGQVTLAQPGGPFRPTSLPEVNAVLSRYRIRSPF
ncbi:hypothetical protein GCM10012275_19290 [Longimycelium tulufanense]|uniref:Uncharacterized protein n=1 Tax=Longimycelium tulufanense TaxID=907463 RepID=A0A8J3CEG5_9PSEU|nr:hypothetical protein [Longimycelium tulufanense]GGM48473.1 hypothetical protein GCM10012275_19290 [Longimycelium tulufanense]